MLVSSVIGKKAPNQIIRHLVEQGLFEMVVCPKVIKEVKKTFEKPSWKKTLSPDEATQHVELIETLSVLVPNPEDVKPVTRDPDDDYLVALALEHNADYIVSGDKDLREWDGQNPPVLIPAQFMKLLLAQEEATPPRT